MHAAGAESLRLPVYWHDVQPDGPDSSDFTALDTEVAAAARAHLRVLAVVLWAPPWAASGKAAFNAPPRHPSDYARFLTLLIHRYGPHGSFWSANPALPRMPVRDWQIWNEPDHRYYWRTQPFVHRYVALLRAAHRAIKRADHGAKVVMAGFATIKPNWPVIHRLYRAGARGKFDVFAIHPYTAKPANVERLVALARRQLRRVHDAHRTLWATEITWPASKGHMRDPYGFAVSAHRQAANIRRVLPLLARNRRSLRLGRVFWESWLTGYRSKSNVFDYSGLRSPGRNRPGLAAFRRAAHALESR